MPSRMDFSGLEAGRLTKSLTVPQDQAEFSHAALSCEADGRGSSSKVGVQRQVLMRKGAAFFGSVILTERVQPPKVP